MARQELQRRLEELNMSASEAKGYGELLTAIQAHMLSLHDLLERRSDYASLIHSSITPFIRSLSKRGRARLGQKTDRRGTG